MRSAPVVLCAAALLVVASACASGGAHSDHLDGPTYASLEELTRSSDVVVTGSFGDVVREVTERELIGEGGDFVGGDAGLSLDLWTFSVSATVKGDPGLAGTEILVTQVSADSAEQTAAGAVYTAAADRESVLFLRPYEDGATYAVTGLGAGSLEMTRDGLVAPEDADAGLVSELAQLDGIDAALEEVAAIADRTAAGPRDTE